MELPLIVLQKDGHATDHPGRLAPIEGARQGQLARVRVARASGLGQDLAAWLNPMSFSLPWRGATRWMIPSGLSPSTATPGTKGAFPLRPLRSPVFALCFAAPWRRWNRRTTVHAPWWSARHGHSHSPSPRCANVLQPAHAAPASRRPTLLHMAVSPTIIATAIGRDERGGRGRCSHSWSGAGSAMVASNRCPSYRWWGKAGIAVAYQRNRDVGRIASYNAKSTHTQAIAGNSWFFRAALDQVAPRVADTAWVADSAQVIGNVELAEDSSVWFGVVVRGRYRADSDWQGNQHSGCMCLACRFWKTTDCG